MRDVENIKTSLALSLLLFGVGLILLFFFSFHRIGRLNKANATLFSALFTTFFYVKFTLKHLGDAFQLVYHYHFWNDEHLVEAIVSFPSFFLTKKVEAICNGHIKTQMTVNYFTEWNNVIAPSIWIFLIFVKFWSVSNFLPKCIQFENWDFISNMT